jgi:hypothetical protein
MPRRARHTGKMPPYRLRREARTCDFDWLASLTEDDAYKIFADIRWRANDGKPYCPACGSARCYGIRTRRGVWSCAARKCRKQFSVTSGTIFHSRKLPFLKLVKLLFHFISGPKGFPALQMSFLVDCQYKSAYVNQQKLRQAMGSERNELWLSGKVEVDGAYFGGKVKPANMKKERVDRRKLKKLETSKERCVIVFRMRDDKKRLGKAIAFATEGETQPVLAAAARALLKPGVEPIFFSDGHKAYEDLEAFGPLFAGDHSKGYSIKGVNTNQAENFFSRARRAEYGSYHHMGATWLDLYAGEISWRENNRRVGNREAMFKALTQALDHPVSRILKGYWQHWLLPDDELERKEVRWRRIFGPMWGGKPTLGNCLVA